MRIIAGRFKGKKITAPKKLATPKKITAPKTNEIRPTSDRLRESIFNILSNKFNNDFSHLRVLDLFAGTGALGIEAISRGAQSVVFVDDGIEARSLLRQNIENFAIAGEAKLLKRSAIDLSKNEKFAPFNLIFLDPPYGKGLSEKALLNASENGWIEKNATIILEEKAGIDLELPSDFTLLEKRKYGGSEIYFLQY
ncbi:MAG: 16S rRNA (guanine(966)-N(2))-methyltransferase RsmD [Devosiaceae bacterium]|nr:16S rRNA (guanine(966)-N(2))-methyltransferase RsmD [Devosiaceae bacterium]